MAKRCSVTRGTKGDEVMSRRTVFFPALGFTLPIGPLATLEARPLTDLVPWRACEVGCIPDESDPGVELDSTWAS